jgi:predicted dehydrogenase
MSHSPIKLIQVGVGGWGWSWLQVVQESELVELVAIVDLDPAIRKRAQAEYGIPEDRSFDSLTEAMTKVPAEAALVIVPPEFHAKVAIEAFEHGLHCLVEKPLAGTVEDANAMVTASELADLKLMVSQNYRFKRAPQTVRNLVRRGAIGQIGSVSINFQKDPKFGGFRAKMAEPLITDMAIHHFDQVRGLLGLDPLTVRAFSWNPRWSKFEGNASAVVLFEMTNGAVVSYNGSWASQGWQTSWDGDWHILGDEGEIRWADNTIEVRPVEITRTVFMKGATERSGVLHVDLMALPAEERWASLNEFTSAIQANRQPETSGRDNLKSMAMVLGARLAAQRRSVVEISEVLGFDLPPAKGG